MDLSDGFLKYEKAFEKNNIYENSFEDENISEAPQEDDYDLLLKFKKYAELNADDKINILGYDIFFTKPMLDEAEFNRFYISKIYEMINEGCLLSTFTIDSINQFSKITSNIDSVLCDICDIHINVLGSFDIIITPHPEVYKKDRIKKYSKNSFLFENYAEILSLYSENYRELNHESLDFDDLTFGLGDIILTRIDQMEPGQARAMINADLIEIGYHVGTSILSFLSNMSAGKANFELKNKCVDMINMASNQIGLFIFAFVEELRCDAIEELRRKRIIKKENNFDITCMSSAVSRVVEQTNIYSFNRNQFVSDITLALQADINSFEAYSKYINCANSNNMIDELLLYKEQYGYTNAYQIAIESYGIFLMENAFFKENKAFKQQQKNKLKHLIEIEKIELTKGELESIYNKIYGAEDRAERIAIEERKKKEEEERKKQLELEMKQREKELAEQMIKKREEEFKTRSETRANYYTKYKEVGEFKRKSILSLDEYSQMLFRLCIKYLIVKNSNNDGSGILDEFEIVDKYDYDLYNDYYESTDSSPDNWDYASVEGKYIICRHKKNDTFMISDYYIEYGGKIDEVNYIRRIRVDSIKEIIPIVTDQNDPFCYIVMYGNLRKKDDELIDLVCLVYNVANEFVSIMTGSNDVYCYHDAKNLCTVCLNTNIKESCWRLICLKCKTKERVKERKLIKKTKYYNEFNILRSLMMELVSNIKQGVFDMLEDSRFKTEIERIEKKLAIKFRSS